MRTLWLSLLTAMFTLGVKPLMSEPPLLESDTLRIPDSIVADPGEVVTVPIYLINTVAVVGFQLDIRFDSLLSVDRIYAGEALDSFWVDYGFGYDETVLDTVVYILGYTQGNPFSAFIPPGNHVIAYIDFVVSPDLDETHLASVYFYDDSTHQPPRYNVVADTTDFADKRPIKDDGSVLIPLSVSEGRLYYKENRLILNENLLKEKISFGFSIKGDCNVDVAVYDPSGRRVFELVRGRFRAGFYKEEKRLGLPSGIYFLRANLGGKREVRRFVLLK